jgi:transcriptional regulator with XRE-family HTH domain
MITAAQIRAARALLGWSGAELAEAAGLSLQTIRRMESAIGPARSAAINVEAVQRALETAGVLFLPADDEAMLGPGLRSKQI